VNAAHTPEPWSIGGHPNDGSGTEWVEILAPSPFGPRCVCLALKENAPLIAAGPELLSSLASLAAIFDPPQYGDQSESARGLRDFDASQLIEALRNARAVIAKATGECS
jgi:hypothetical protein